MSYNFSLTTFSPTGELGQIKYAIEAVNGGGASVAIKCNAGIILATEKKSPSILVDSNSIHKVFQISETIGAVYSGMGPDARVLIQKARKVAQKYFMIYHDQPPILVLVKEVAKIMQEFTQSGGVRPFGVSLLVAGIDETGPVLYQVDPSGNYFPWKATAIGKGYVNAKEFLQKRYSEDMDLEDAVHTAILTLKENVEGAITAESLDIGIVGGDLAPDSFKRLSVPQISDFLNNIV